MPGVDSANPDITFFFTTWPPHILLFPMVLFFLSTANVSLGELRFLFFQVASAVVLVHNHLPSIVIVGPFVLSAFAFLLFTRRTQALTEIKLRPRQVFSSILLVLVALFPILYEQFTAREGNLTALYKFFILSKEGGGFFKHSTRDAIAYTTLYYKDLVPINRAGLTFGIVVMLSLLNLRRRRDFMSSLVIFNTIGFLVSLIGVRKITGDLNKYLYYFQYLMAGLWFFAPISDY